MKTCFYCRICNLALPADEIDRVEYQLVHHFCGHEVDEFVPCKTCHRGQAAWRRSGQCESCERAAATPPIDVPAIAVFAVLVIFLLFAWAVLFNSFDVDESGADVTNCVVEWGSGGRPGVPVCESPR